MNMDKRSIIAEVAKHTILKKWEINLLVDPLMETIIKALERGEEVHINNFGKFTLKYHKPKETLHPKTRQRIQIPEKISIVFTQTRMFKPTDEAIEALRKQADK